MNIYDQDTCQRINIDYEHDGPDYGKDDNNHYIKGIIIILDKKNNNNEDNMNNSNRNDRSVAYSPWMMYAMCDIRCFSVHYNVHTI